MPTTIADLRTRAALIADATQVGENTANRVGTAFDMVADLLDGLQGITNVSTIDIGNLDTLNTLDDMKSSTPNIYTIVKTIGANTFKLGTLFQFANNGRYDVAQVIVSQFIPDAMGDITTTSADGEVHIYYRICRTQNQGHLPTPVGTWTTWTEIGSGGGGGITIDAYPTEDSTNAVSSGGVFERLQKVAPTIDYAHLDDIDDYADMLAGVSPFYVVTKHIGSNDFRIGTLMEFANQGRYILYQILATDYDLDDDGVLDTNVSINGGLKLIWRMKQFSGVPPQDVTLNVWSRWWYLSGGGGGSITIDPTPTSGSQNAVSSGGVYDALALKQNTLTFDNAPTNGSNNPVKSGGVYTALQGKQATLTFDNSPTNGSNNPVKSGGIYTALGAKQDTLTFDETPTAGSDNPVKSKGIKTYVDNGDTTILTNLSTNYYTKTQVDNLIIPQGIDALPVAALPAQGDPNTLYFVQGANSFTISMWDGAAWITLATISGAYDAGGALN